MTLGESLTGISYAQQDGYKGSLYESYKGFVS